MTASQYHLGASVRGIRVTNSVTNWLGNRGQCRAIVTNSVTKLRAIQGHEITTFGEARQWRGTEGNASLGLITQRSKVQILPPQPTHSKLVRFNFFLSKNQHKFDADPLSHSFFRNQIGDSSLGLASVCGKHKLFVVKQIPAGRSQMSPILSPKLIFPTARS